MTLPADEVDQDASQKLTILVVEDDALARISVAQHLRERRLGDTKQGAAEPDAVPYMNIGFGKPLLAMRPDDLR